MTTRGTGQIPGPDGQDEYPDSLWPDDEQDADGPDAGGRPAPVRAAVPADGHVPWKWPVPPPAPAAPEVRERKRRILTLAVTGILAAGLGAGTVLVYRSTHGGAALAAAASPGTGQAPGQGGGPAGSGGGQAGPLTQLQVLARVTAVRSGTITFGGGPGRSVTASVTSATRFTGSVRTLAAVRVGDTVAAQIVIENGVARVVTLADPASQP
jgi:hypothetical protein